MSRSTWLALALLALSACGGGGGSSSPAPSTFTVSVAVAGLAGGTLVLQNNSGDSLAVATNGSASFATALASGATYAVSIKSSPTGQTCTLANATGTIPGANVTNVSATCTSGSNVAAITVDAGPSGATFTNINVPFVTVTVCTPGTSTCATVDHVLVDTGSTGLRVGQWALGALALPAVTVNSQPLIECYQFADGYIWGAVRSADVSIANGTAHALPIHVIADAAAPAKVPSDCSNGSKGALTPESSLAALGSNGTLGLDIFQYDCDAYCVTNAAPGLYYLCPGGTCANSTASLSAQVQNPVFGFTGNTNGVVIVLPSVNAAGQATASGSLVLGIDTQPDNQLGSAQILSVDANCAADVYCSEFNTIYHASTGDQTLQGSFIDSGSNGLFFADTASNSPVTACTQSGLTGFYCPASTLALTANNVSRVNGASIATSFTVANINTLLTNNPSATALPGAAGSNPVGGFDWGLPFFYGRSVFVAFETQTTSAGPGPFYAY